MLEYAAMDRELNHYMEAIEETVNQVNCHLLLVTKTCPYLNTTFQQMQMLHYKNRIWEKQIIKRYEIPKLPGQQLIFLPACSMIQFLIARLSVTAFPKTLAPVRVRAEQCFGNM